jgi:DmsE family decaheme c-type cytochrome
MLIGCSALDKRADVIKAPEVAPGAVYVGSETCLDCHEDLGNDKHNIHMSIAEFEVTGGYRTGCESCHGPGSAHVDGDGDTELILKFGEEGIEPEEVSGVCTTCHRTGEHMNWAGSMHAEYDVACTQCHKVHGNSNKTLLAKKRELDLCSTCHQDINAQMYLMSHHPVKEGRMNCSDCHNPHGSSSLAEGMLRTDERLTDLCLPCHTRYQGPFVYELDPVVEDCTICHNPHGTVANNLLQQQEPFICLQCHEAHFHAARASNNVNAHGIPGGGSPYDNGKKIPATNYGFQQSFMTKCTQCHPQVHGSDLTSQTVTSGHGLTR